MDMDVILDYSVRTYKAFDNGFCTERGLTEYANRLDDPISHDVAALVERYDALPGIEATGEMTGYTRSTNGVVCEKEVYRIHLSGDDVDVARFLEETRELGYGTPESYGPSSISTDDHVQVLGRLAELVASQEHDREHVKRGWTDTPRGEMPRMVVRWERC